MEIAEPRIRPLIHEAKAWCLESLIAILAEFGRTSLTQSGYRIRRQILLCHARQHIPKGIAADV